jgi:hypothetical protein
MVFMILAKLLFLFRKMEEGLKGGLDLVQPHNMAHSLLYSTNHANDPTKKRSNKVCFLLDKCAAPCYNKNITIEKGKKLEKT